MPEERLLQLIAKHLAGETTKTEEDWLNHWLAQPGNRKIYSFYEAMWCDTRLDYKSPRGEKVFQLVETHINESRKKDLRLKYPQRKKPPLGYFFAIAAAFAFLIVSFTSLYVMSDRNRDFENTNEPLVIERNLPKGQKMKIFLPDGSIVWLNAESKLSYPERFDNHQRQVYLQGEAYFEIAKDAEKPFMVKTNDLDVIALGTSFNVKNYIFEDDVSVGLNTGKVLVKGDAIDEEFTLDPGQGVFYKKNDSTIYKGEIDRNAMFLWKDGILYFKDAPFKEVFGKLSQWYGVEFEFEGQEGQKWSYTGKFIENEYLSNVLKSISFTKGFDYTIDQNKVLVKFKKQI